MQTDVLVIGAGAAGLMCAIQAGKRQRKVLVIDKANKMGKKILMSGGGRCNFTNYYIEYDKYLSHNPHFCKSALSRYTQWDFIEMVRRHNIAFHEKTKGQLFCDNKSADIVNMLFAECEKAQVTITLNTEPYTLEPLSKGYQINTSKGMIKAQAVVIATGGLSIPTLGSSPFAYQIAEQLGIHVWPTRAGLVPLTLTVADKARLSMLSGISVAALVRHPSIDFQDDLLFTHRGLSGPAILQISSYWQTNDTLDISLLPNHALLDSLKQARKTQPQKQLSSILANHLPKRLLDSFIPALMLQAKLVTLSNQKLQEICTLLQCWQLKPHGTEGYRTAEVTLGGIDCNAISSQTMQALAYPNLYFVGEALDVTGWLGGYNFQWAWSSGWAAGQVV